MSPDGCAYLMLSNNVLGGDLSLELFGRGTTYSFPPLYPILIAILNFIFANAELSGRIVSLLFGMSTVLLVYFLSFSLYGRGVSHVSVLLTALFPALVIWSNKVATESVFIALLVMGMLLCWKMTEKRTFSYCLLSGCVLGLSYLARAIGILNIGIGVLWLIIFGAVRKIGFRKTVVLSMFLLIGFGIIASPYIIYMRAHTGKWTITPLSQGAMQLTEKRRDVAYKEKVVAELTADCKDFKLERETQDRGGIITWMREHPERFFRKYTGNMAFVFKRIRKSLLPVICWVFCVVGLVPEKWNREGLVKKAFLLIWIIPYVLVLPAINVQTRYFYPLIPIFLIMAASGIFRTSLFLGRLSNVKNLSAKIASLLTAIVVLVLIVSVSKHFEKIKKRCDDITVHSTAEEVGVWIKGNLSQNQIIMARAPNISFYANGKWLLIPHDEYARIIKFAHFRNADLMIIDNYNIPKKRPQLSFLLNEEVPDELELIYEWNKDDRFRTLVYRIKR